MGFRRAMMMASNYVRSVIQSFVNYTAVFNAWYEADYCLERSLDDLNRKDLLYNASLVVTPNSYKEGLLYNVFPSKKNLLINSGYFNLSPWTTGGATITPNAGIAPDGTLTAYLYNDTGASGTPGVIIQAFTATSNILTCSIYLKASATTIDRRLALRNSNTATIFDILVINLNTGVFTGAGWTVVALPNGWYRCIYTKSTGFTIGNTMQFYTARTGGATVGATDQWFAWGAQVEQGYNVTTYSQTYASIIPTFTRNSTATRLNSSGFVEVVPSQNLLLQSETFDNINWVKGAATVTANSVIAINGTTTADTLVGNTIGTNPVIYQALTLLPNTLYNFSVYIKKSTNNTIPSILLYDVLTATQNAIVGFDFSNTPPTQALTSGTQPITNVTITDVNNDWYRCSFTSQTSLINTSYRIYIYGDRQSITLSNTIFWGAQVTQTSTIQPYFPTTTRFNIPRANYLVGGTCPTLLLEPQRTNLYLRSEPTAAEGLSGGVPAVTYEAYNWNYSNFTNCVRFATGVVTSVTYRYGGTVSVVANDYYTLSFYIIMDDNGIPSIGLDSTTGDFSIIIANTYSTGIRKIENVYGNIYRVSSTLPAPTISTFSTLNGIVKYSGQSTRGFRVTGLQLELGAFPTSYIQTTGTIVTRTAESLTVPTPYTSNLITSLGGTWLIDFKNAIQYIRDVPSANNGMFIGSGASANIGNSIAIRIAVSTASYLSIYKYISGAATPLYTLTNANSKIVIKWDGTYINIFINGIQVVTNSAFTATNMNNMIYSIQSPTNIKTIALYPLPLTDAQCLSLSTQ